ncbi:glycosyltransferase [Cryomorpha ignava]|uniref:Glycosyltransferase n=1 Tax=Cryomorpha ignava TaxID=101383 RepID=A0A7K3WTJ7_9FLAO|nr:glycosyltransferase [Cryomorpha ignava]NEN23985.1 glycosyltransferase [Cryomorpha ignava]
MESADLYGLAFFLIAGIFVSILIFLLFHGCRSKEIPSDKLNGLTILIPFKNEKAVLPHLIKQLTTKLKLNPTVCVWLLNDHSTDLSATDLEKLELPAQIKLFPPIKGVTGKKAVWREAIKRVETEWVLIMDADTEPSELLFTSGVRLIPKGAKCLLIPIIPSKRMGAIASFFDLDFLSLHFAGLASAKANKPLLANAACMLMQREAFLKSAKERNDWSEPGGDDVFAMFAIAKMFGANSITTVQNASLFTKVHFPKQAASLWYQRLRWISKTGKIKNAWFQFIAWTVLFAQILFLIGLFFLFKSMAGFLTLVAAAMIIIAEIVYLALISAKLKRRDLWPYILPAIFIYPFYLLALVIFGTFAKPKWK